MYLLQDLGYLKPRYTCLHPSNFNGALEFHPLSVTSFQARPETNQCLCACWIGWSPLKPLAHIEKSQRGWSKISFASFYIMVKMRILVAQAASRSQQKSISTRSYLQNLCYICWHRFAVSRCWQLVYASLSMTFSYSSSVIQEIFAFYSTSQNLPSKMFTWYTDINQTLGLSDES